VRKALLGIEIGGTKLQLGVGFPDQPLAALWRGTVDPHAGAQGILAQILEAVPRVLDQAGGRSNNLEAVGIGFGGPVDVRSGTIVKSFQVPGWEQFALVEWVREQLSVEHVALANDADAAGLAEAVRGAGQGYSPLLYSNIGSGIGGALVVDGRIYTGSGRGAVEIGHLLVPDPENSSSFVELESIASGWGIARLAREYACKLSQDELHSWLPTRHGAPPNSLTPIDLAHAALAGDAPSIALFQRARLAFAFALAQTVTLLAPARIVIGGGVSLTHDSLWLHPLQQDLQNLTLPPLRGTFDLVKALLGEEVVVHGALILAQQTIASL